jgi:peptidyl-prolyl cis-trans isomerase C
MNERSPDIHRPSSPRAPFRALVILAAAAAIVWSSASSGPKKQPDAGDVLVRVGDDVLRRADAQAEVDRMPPAARARYASPEERRAFFDRMVKNEILAAEARRLGYDRDPEVVLATKKAMVQKLLKERIRAEPAPSEVTEAAIARYYQEHAREFVHPEEVRVTEVVSRTREEALDVLREAEKADDLTAFRALVFARSADEASKARGGDLTIVGRPGDVPGPVVDAALALDRVGALSPVIETPKGFHVLKLRQRVPASRRSLEESRARIARLLADDGRDRKVDELVGELRRSVKVEVFEERFAGVRLGEAVSAR